MERREKSIGWEKGRWCVAATISLKLETERKK